SPPPVPGNGEPVTGSPAPAAVAAAVAAVVPVPRADPGAVDDVLGGLAEVHTLIARLRGIADVRALDQRLDHIERELRAVRQDAERLRLLSAGSLFIALERTARDAAHAAGKRVVFTGVGG